MNQVCYVLPVPGGKVDAVRRLMRELKEARRRDYAASRERMGILREDWYLQPTPRGAVLVIRIEGADVARVLQRRSLSPDPFEQWLVVRMQECTGLDLGHADAMALAEKLYSYEAQRAHLHV